MSVLPYHKRYHGDALTGFMALTLEERGAYQTILDMIYDRGGPILDDERLLAGYMKCSLRKWRTIRDELIAKRKIRITRDGLISNDRAEKEIENTAKTSRKHAENGSKGGRNRGKPSENEKKPNENSDGPQAGLERGLSEAQAIRALPEARNQREEASTPRSQSLPADVQAVLEAGGYVSPPPDLGLLRQWREAGATLEQDIVPVIKREAAGLLSRTGKPPRTLKIFDAALREKLAEDERYIEHLRKVARRNMVEPLQ